MEIRQLDILFEYSWDCVARHVDRVSMLWEATEWISNFFKKLACSRSWRTNRSFTVKDSSGKVIVYAEPERWMRDDPFMELQDFPVTDCGS